MSDDTIILHEMVPKWNRLFKQKGVFRQIRWCEVHYLSCDRRVDGTWLDECAGDNQECDIVDKWLES